MQYQNISRKQFLVAKGLSYDVTMLKVIFSRVKITISFSCGKISCFCTEAQLIFH